MHSTAGIYDLPDQAQAASIDQPTSKKPQLAGGTPPPTANNPAGNGGMGGAGEGHAGGMVGIIGEAVWREAGVVEHLSGGASGGDSWAAGGKRQDFGGLGHGAARGGEGWGLMPGGVGFGEGTGVGEGDGDTGRKEGLHAVFERISATRAVLASWRWAILVQIYKCMCNIASLSSPGQ
jgi:hypothetical protein